MSDRAIFILGTAAVVLIVGIVITILVVTRP
jgi:hypothetical protein